MDYKILKEKYLLFLPPLILILLCLLIYLIWNFSFKNKASLSAIKISNLEKKVEEEKRLNSILKEELREWERNISEINKFKEYLGSAKDNLTSVIKEIEDLSFKAGVVPHSYGFSFSEKEREDFIGFNIDFPFESDYSGVRNFLHMLELSPTFIILSSINLNTSGELSEKVRLQFKLTTFFATEKN